MSRLPDAGLILKPGTPAIQLAVLFAGLGIVTLLNYLDLVGVLGLGYQMLKQRMENKPDLPNPMSDHWYISYKGEQYLLEIGGWVV